MSYVIHSRIKNKCIISVPGNEMNSNFISVSNGLDKGDWDVDITKCPTNSFATGFSVKVSHPDHYP